MTPLSNTTQIRKADEVMGNAYQFPSLLLMETAGRKAAEWILAHEGNAHIYYVLAGPATMAAMGW